MTAPPRDQDHRDRTMVIVLVIVLAVIVLAFLAAIVGLEVAGRSPESVLYLLSAVLIPTAVSVGNAWLTYKTRVAVGQVEQHVNGKMTRLLDAAGVPRRAEDDGLEVAVDHRLDRVRLEPEVPAGRGVERRRQWRDAPGR